MINTIKLKEPKAKEIIATLTKEYSWRFRPLINGEATIIYVFYDEYGFEYSNNVFFKASKDNKKIIVYVNKKEFPTWIRHEDLDTAITELIKDYINDAYPHIAE